MPMTGDGMASAVVAAFQAVDPEMTEAQIAQITTAWTEICEAIVSYIQENAEVEGTVESGAGAGGSVTGTVS